MSLSEFLLREVGKWPDVIILQQEITIRPEKIITHKVCVVCCCKYLHTRYLIYLFLHCF